jgi:hypothetical protein
MRFKSSSGRRISAEAVREIESDGITEWVEDSEY